MVVAQQKKDKEEIQKQGWKTQVTETLKVFGHRNWNVIADGSYLKLSNPSIKTNTIGAGQLEDVKHVAKIIQDTIT